MTLDEAKLVAKVCATADGGCSVCVGNLAEKLNIVFPEFVWKDMKNPAGDIEIEVRVR